MICSQPSGIGRSTFGTPGWSGLTMVWVTPLAVRYAPIVWPSAGAAALVSAVSDGAADDDAADDAADEEAADEDEVPRCRRTRSPT